MIIRLPDHMFAMELPDEWLTAAGMTTFAPSQPSYRAAPYENANLPTTMLLLTSIWLQSRAPNVPDFGKERMISVLQGIRLDQELPPIEVEAEAFGKFSHRLYHGRHRFAASLAMRFTHIPAVVSCFR